MSASPTEPAGPQYAAVLERLSERRRELGMSMSALARKIGVSPSMISQIERGQSLPSVETLFALAEALGATVDTFFGAASDDAAAGEDAAPEDGPSPGRAVTAAAATAPAPEDNSHQYFVPREGRAAISIQGGIRWERLTPRAMVDFDFLELIYEPGAESSEHLYPHPGFEMVLVLAGRFEIHIGFECYILDPGDSIAFASSLPHRYVNPLTQESRAVTTIIHDPLVGLGGPTNASSISASARAVRRGHP